MIPDRSSSSVAPSGAFTIAGPTRAAFRRYAHRWLLVIPFIWQIGLAPFVNTTAVRVFSLPLPMVWQMCGILIATAIIATVFVLDERLEGGVDPSERDDPTPAEGRLS